MKKTITDAVKTFSQKWVTDAIHEASMQGKRNWKYCRSILERWGQQGDQEPDRAHKLKSLTRGPSPRANSDRASLADEYSEEWVSEAVDIATSKGKHSEKYVEAILKNWKENGKNEIRKHKSSGRNTVMQPVIPSPERQEELRRFAAEQLMGSVK